MQTIENAKSAKLIGIGDNGIRNLESIKDKVQDKIDLDSIQVNQDVDKDYVRKLLDGVDILLLTYDSEDKRALQIVNAIAFMANERRILSIGLDSSEKENKDDININRVFKLEEKNSNDLISILNMMIDSISDFCTINMDLTDLKEALASDKGIKCSYKEFSNDLSKEDIVNRLFEEFIQTEEELTGKKEIILIEMGTKYCKSESDTLFYINELLMEIQSKREDTYEGIFSLYLKEELEQNMKVTLIYN